MPINIEADKLYFGETPIARVYSGSDRVWPPEESTQEQTYEPDTSYVPTAPPAEDTFPYILRITLPKTRSVTSEFLTLSRIKFYDSNREEINVGNFYSASTNGINYSSYDVDNILETYNYSYFATDTNTEEPIVVTAIYKEALTTPTYFSIVTSSDSALTDPVSFLIEYSSDSGETFTTWFDLSDLDITRFRKAESKLFDVNYVVPTPSSPSWIPIYPENWNLFNYGNIANGYYMDNPSAIYLSVPRKIYKDIMGINEFESGTLIEGENSESTSFIRSINFIPIEYITTLGIETNTLLNKTIKYYCQFYDESYNYIGTSLYNSVENPVELTREIYVPLNASYVKILLCFADGVNITPEDITKCNLLLDFNYNNYDILETSNDWIQGSIDDDTGVLDNSAGITDTCVYSTLIDLPTLLSSIKELSINIRAEDIDENKQLQYKLYLYDSGLNYLYNYTLDNNCLTWKNLNSNTTFAYNSSDIKYIKIMVKYSDDSSLAPENILDTKIFIIYNDFAIINNRNDYAFAETSTKYDLTEVENIVIPVDIPSANFTNNVKVYISQHSLNTASQKYNPDCDLIIGSIGESFTGNVNFNVSRFTGEYYIGFVSEYGNDLCVYDIDKTDMVTTLQSCYKFNITNVRNEDFGKLRFSEIKFFDSNLIPININNNLISITSNVTQDGGRTGLNIVDKNNSTYFSSDFSEGDTVEITFNFNNLQIQPTYFSLVTSSTRVDSDPTAFELYYSGDAGVTFTKIIDIEDAEMPISRNTESVMFYNGYVKPVEPIGPIEPEEPTGWIPFTTENWNLFSNDSVNCISEITLSPITLHLKNTEPYSESNLSVDNSSYESGSIDINTGNNISDVTSYRIRDYITIPNRTANVTIDCRDTNDISCDTTIYFYNSYKQYLLQKTITSRTNLDNSTNDIIIVPADAKYIRFITSPDINTTTITWNDNISYYKLINVKNIAWSNSDIYPNNTIATSDNSNIITSTHYIAIPDTAQTVNLNPNFYENNGLKCRAFLYDNNRNYLTDLTHSINNLQNWYDVCETKSLRTKLINTNTDSHLRNGGSTFAFSHSNGITIEDQSFSDNKLNLHCSETSSGFEGFTIALQNLTIDDSYTVTFDFNSIGYYYTSDYDHLFGFTISDSPVLDYENSYDSSYTSLNKTEDFVSYSKSFTATASTMYMIFNVAGYSDSITNSFHINNLSVWEETSTPVAKYIRFAIKYNDNSLLKTDTLKGGFISFDVTNPVTEYVNNHTYAETVNTVNLQTIKQLTANVTANSSSTDSINIYISSISQLVDPDTFSPTLLQAININGTDDIVFDVESYNGSYYIGFESGLGSELTVNSLDRVIKDNPEDEPDTPIPGSQIFNLLIFNHEWVAGVYDSTDDTMTPSGTNTHLRCNYYIPIVDSDFLVQSISSDDTVLQNCVVFYNANKEVVFTSPWTVNEYTRYSALPGTAYYRIVVRHPEEGTGLNTSSITTSNIYFDETIDMEDLYVYTELAAVRSDGNAYIDTGIIPTANTRVMLSMRNLTTENTAIFIASSTWQENRFYLTYANNGFIWGIPEYVNLGGEKELTNTFNIYRGTVTLNQEVVVDEEVTNAYVVQDSTNLYIFNTPSIANKGSTFSLKYFKIYENGILVRDYIPILDYNGVPSLFDKINYTYTYNAGSGTLTPEYDTGLDERVMPEMRSVVGVYHLFNYMQNTWRNSTIGLSDVTINGNINSGVVKTNSEITVPPNGYSLINNPTNEFDSEVRFIYNRLFTYPHYSTAPTFDLPSGIKQYYLYVRYAPGKDGTNSNILGDNTIFTSDSPILLVNGISNITNIFNATSAQVTVPDTLPEIDLPYMFMYCTNSLGGEGSQIVASDVDTLLFNNDPPSQYRISVDNSNNDSHYTTYTYTQTGTDEHDEPIYQWIETNTSYIDISWDGTNSDLKSIITNTFPHNAETVHWGHGTGITNVYVQSEDPVNSPLYIYYKRDDDSNSSEWTELNSSTYNYLQLPYANGRYYGWQVLYNNFTIQSEITNEILNRPAMNYIYKNSDGNSLYNFNDSFTFYFIAKEGEHTTKYSTKNIFDYRRLGDTTNNVEYVDSNTNTPAGLYTLDFDVEPNSQYILYTNLPGDSVLLQTLDGQHCTSENNGYTTLILDIGDTNKLYLLFDPTDYYYTDAVNGLFEIQLEKIEQCNKHIYQDSSSMPLSTNYEAYIVDSTNNGVIFSTLNSMGEGIEISSLDRSLTDEANIITIKTSDGILNTNVNSSEYHLYTLTGSSGTASLYVDDVLVLENITYTPETLNTTIKLCKDSNDIGSDYINHFKFLALSTIQHTNTEIIRNANYLTDLYNIDKYTGETLLVTTLYNSDFEKGSLLSDSGALGTGTPVNRLRTKNYISIPEGSTTFSINNNYGDSAEIEYLAWIYDSTLKCVGKTVISPDTNFISNNSVSILPQTAKFIKYILRSANENVLADLLVENLVFSKITWNKDSNKYYIVTLPTNSFEQGNLDTSEEYGNTDINSDYVIRSTYIELPLNLDFNAIQIRSHDTNAYNLSKCILFYDSDYNYLYDYTLSVCDNDITFKDISYVFYLPFLRRSRAKYIRIIHKRMNQYYLYPNYLITSSIIYMNCLRETELRNLNWNVGTFDNNTSTDINNITNRVRCEDYIDIENTQFMRFNSRLIGTDSNDTGIYSNYYLYYYRENNLNSGSYMTYDGWFRDWDKINIAGTSVQGNSLEDANYMRLVVRRNDDDNLSLTNLKRVEISILPKDAPLKTLQPYVYKPYLPATDGIVYDFDFLDESFDSSYLTIVEGTSNDITEAFGHGINIDKSTILSYILQSDVIDEFTIYLVTEENSTCHLFTFTGSVTDDYLDVYIDGIKVDEGFNYLEEPLDSDSSNTLYYKYFAIGTTKQDYADIITNNNYLLDKYSVTISKKLYLYSGTLPATISTYKPVLEAYRIYGSDESLGIKENLYNLHLEQGTMVNGHAEASNTRIRTTTSIELEPGTYTIYNSEGYSISCHYYTSSTINSGSFGSDSGWQTSPYTFTVSYPNNYVQFLFSNQDTSITPNDITDVYLLKKDYVTLPFSSSLCIEYYNSSTISSESYATKSDWVDGPYTFTIDNNSTYIQILMCAKDDRELDLNTMGIIQIKDNKNNIVQYLTKNEFELGSMNLGSTVSSTTKIRTICTINLEPGNYTIEHIIPTINYNHYTVPITSTIGAKTLTTYVDIGTRPLNSNEYVDSATQLRHNSNGSVAHLNLPVIPTFNGSTIIDMDATIKADKVELIYLRDIEP